MKYLACLLLLCSIGANAQITKGMIRANKYRNALEKLSKQADSANAGFYYERGNIELDYKDYIPAIADYTKALQMSPDNPKIYYNRGIAKMEMNDLQGAIADFDKAIKLDPKKAFAYNNRSVCKYMLQDYIGAIQDSSMAILLEPANAEAHNNRGISKIKLGLKDEGCEDLHKAYDLGDKKSKQAIKDFCKK